MRYWKTLAERQEAHAICTGISDNVVDMSINYNMICTDNIYILNVIQYLAMNFFPIVLSCYVFQELLLVFKKYTKI